MRRIQSVAHSRPARPRERKFPVGLGRALSEAPVEIDGMRVLFDKRVSLFPVTLVETPKATASSRRGRKRVRRL